VSRVSDAMKKMRAFADHQRRAMEAKEGGFRCADHPAYFLKAFRGTGGTVQFLCPSCYREHDISDEVINAV